MRKTIKVLFIAGIMGIAVFSGTLKALNSPRKIVKKEGKQEEGKAETA